MSRPVLIERTDYTPAFPVEEFIVPLLQEQILKTIPPLHRSRVLDVGCGRQPFRKYFEARECTYVSTDAQDPVGIVDYVAEIDAPLSEALMAAAPFDFVFCTEVLEHVADWNQAFQNFNRLLNRDGLLFVTCPHMYILHEVPYDFWRPTTYGLSFYASRWGFEAVTLEKAGSSWDVVGTVLGANLGSAKAIQLNGFNRALAYAVNLVTRVGFRVLSSRFLQKRVRWGADRFPIYMSNIALFRKVAPF